MSEAPLLERAIQEAFVAAPGALPCRPEPRGPFDRAAAHRTTPWRAFGLPLRATCTAAAAIGGPAIEATRTRVIRALLALAGWILEPLDEGVPLATLLYSQLMREQAEAFEAQALAHGLGTEEARARALRETQEAITAQRLWCVTQLEDSPRWRAVRRPLPYSAPAGALS